MDLTPLFYLLVMLTLFIVLMRLRKLAMRPTNAPRVHRATYKQVKL